MPVSSARLKLKRAHEHIAEIKNRVDLLPASDVASVGVNSDTGQKFVKHDIMDKSALEDIALYMGDAVHNLKSALDHAWLAVITRLAPRSLCHKTLFPVYPTPELLEDALRKREIDTSSKALFNVVINDIKPYKGGDHAIWAIHKLDITDKHKLLVPIATYSTITGLKFEDETGKVLSGSTYGTTQPAPWYIPMNEGWHVKDHGKPVIGIHFGKGTGLEHFDVLDILQLYSSYILRVVEQLERC